MSSARKSIHFDAQGKAAFFAQAAECGASRHGKRPQITTSPEEVTCQRCKRTVVFREFVRQARALPLLGMGVGR